LNWHERAIAAAAYFAEQHGLAIDLEQLAGELP
jgi:hypothetical protein